MRMGARHQIAIAGKVFYARNGSSVAGARVQASGPSVAQTRTAPDGIFYFFDLEEGSYTVEAALLRSGNRYAKGKGEAEVLRDDSGGICRTTVEIALDATTVAGKITCGGHDEGLIMADVR